MSTTRAAARVQRIKQSPSGAAADRAHELKRQGKAIISLVVGEPDFATPAHIRQAAWDAMERGDTRYTHNAGTPALREAIVAKLKRENGVSYTINDIIVTPGAKSAVYLALAATLNPGDEVIIPAPYWVSYPDMVKLCEGEPVIVPCPETDGFKLTPARLAQAITPRTRWLVINSPSNPTGACYTADEYRALAAVLIDHPQVMIMTDEIYEHIRFGDQENPHLLAIAPALRERTLIVNGVSKSYAMTGWRIGFVAGPPDVIKAIAVVKSQTSGATCSISQAAAVAAYEGDQSSLAANRETYRTRQSAALALINVIDGLSCLPPAGAFYLYVNCGGVIGKRKPDGATLESDGDVVLYLLENAEVALVAGAAYGLSPYFRISIATDLDTIETGIARIARALSQLI
ncbi:Aminotransferase class I and II [Sodalis praecaptivus]|uniref:Aminotransferase n=1 Tax=Sodalis praecaptivus TaxID=1239307 RepID=W0HS06_9GAMM|nr:aspartate transaminase [Sodalis praecaptivus]AHF76611.1 Aminotransferase class I and II [Sodalis praecaptivus]